MSSPPGPPPFGGSDPQRPLRPVPRARPARRLLAGLLLFALLEVVVLIQFAALVGAGWTFAVLGGSALLGLIVLSRAMSSPGSRQGRGFDVVCGLLLLLPGLLSSLLALVLLVPGVRRAVRTRWRQWARDRGLVSGSATVIVMEPLDRRDDRPVEEPPRGEPGGDKPGDDEAPGGAGGHGSADDERRELRGEGDGDDGPRPA